MCLFLVAVVSASTFTRLLVLRFSLLVFLTLLSMSQCLRGRSVGSCVSVFDQIALESSNAASVVLPLVLAALVVGIVVEASLLGLVH